MAIYKRGETWWADITVRGVRTRRSLGTDSAAEAKRRERELIAQAKTPASSRTLHDALGAWLDERERGRSDISILQRLNGLPNPPLTEVSNAWCRQHLGDLGPGNYNRHVAVVRSAMRLAVEHGWIATAPTLEKRQEPAAKERFLTREEWERLREALPEHLRDLAEFAVASGLRQENVLRLRWAQVDIERKVAWVHATETKAGRSITVPLSASAVEVLRRQVGRHAEFVFVTNRGKPWATTPKTAWAVAVERAGLAGLRWHDLRHTWASWHVQAGTPLAVLQELGGWASLDMVRRYAHFAPEHLAAFADAVKTGQKPVALRVVGA